MAKITDEELRSVLRALDDIWATFDEFVHDPVVGPGLPRRRAAAVLREACRRGLASSRYAGGPGFALGGVTEYAITEAGDKFVGRV